MVQRVEYGRGININEEALKTLRYYISKLERGEMLNRDEMSTLMEIYRTADEAITKVGELAKKMAGEPEEEAVLKKGEVREIDDGIFLFREKDGKVGIMEVYLSE